LEATSSVTRFFQQSLPKFCSNFTKLRKILPNVGFPSNYVIIMPKNNSCVIKVEIICTKSVSKASRKRITDGTRRTLGVSSPCLLDCLWLHWDFSQIVTYPSISKCATRCVECRVKMRHFKLLYVSSYDQMKQRKSILFFEICRSFLPVIKCKFPRARFVYILLHKYYLPPPPSPLGLVKQLSVRLLYILIQYWNGKFWPNITVISISSCASNVTFTDDGILVFYWANFWPDVACRNQFRPRKSIRVIWVIWHSNRMAFPVRICTRPIGKYFVNSHSILDFYDEV
jgi:hypothetical protein